MFSVPVYTAAGSCGSVPVLRSMLNAIRSVRLLWRFAAVTATLASCSPALAAPNGALAVSAVEGPALSEILNAEDGMLFPAPSVRAAAALPK